MLLKTIRKKKIGFLFWALAYIVFFTACSSKKNTTATRAYHELTTRYNIYFNAEETYEEILKERANTFHENDGELLPFYPSTKDKSATGGPFDPVIEKTEKAIREHSITGKPRRKSGKAYSQEYRQWLQQEEFNPFLKNVWMLRGKALLQNGDYEEALTVFSGMLRQFNHDREFVNETEIWMLRTYTEMGRIYEAEQTIYTLSNKELSAPQRSLFTEHYTYHLILKKKFPEAIPQLQKTITGKSDYLQKKRLQFLLGQLYAMTGEKDRAYQAFEEVKGLRTPPELTLNVTRWQSAIANDSLSSIFDASRLYIDLAEETIAIENTTDSITQNIHPQQNTRSRLSEGRSLSENASLHRQWRSRNNLREFRSANSTKIEDEQVIPFSSNKSGLHHLLFSFTPGLANKNHLLFITANFNFSHFKLRRFNLSYNYLSGREILHITPFHSFEEVSQYTDMLFSDSLFRSAAEGIIPIIISQENMQLIQSGRRMDEYNTFYVENIVSRPTAAFQPIIGDETVEIREKGEHKPEKVVSLKISSMESPHQTERETTESLKRRLEENAAKALQQQEMAPRKNRKQLLKERERQREARIREREKELKERQRKREAALKQRERERAREKEEK